MIALLDESGNKSIKPVEGTSQFFLVSVVLFLDDDEANACDARISRLREELGYARDFEFHFSKNSKRVRHAFLDAVKDFDFQYFAVGINKFSENSSAELKRGDDELYKYACGIALTSCLPYLDHAILVIDKSGSKAFQTSLRRYLRDELKDKDGKRIKKFKPQKSEKNNLLQLVDYCVGVLARKVAAKKDWEEFYQYIAKKEISFIEMLK